MTAAGAAMARSKAFAAPVIASSRNANEKLNIACIGTGGQGGSHLGWCARNDNLVALCDVEENHLNGPAAKYPDARKFTDYREMFDKMHKEIDAVTVGIPDNHHACASMMAIKLGKGVYCEKPLTHDIHEARALAEAARKYKVATQMGNQGRAEEGWRLLCEFIWAGAIGNVTEAHVWTDRPGIPKRPRTAPKAAIRSPHTCIGTSGLGLRRIARSWARTRRASSRASRCTTRSSGEAGGISARAPWATSAATR
jgi:predicted dehydrogenase